MTDTPRPTPQPTSLEIAFRVVEMRSRFPDDSRAQAVADAADAWLDEWAAFRKLPWYRQTWLIWRDQMPSYNSPLR